MPFQPVTTSPQAAAEAAAKQIVQQIESTSARIKQIRQDGIPAIPAQPARDLGNGRSIPAREETPAVSAADIDAALGEMNCAILDGLAKALS